MHTGIDIGVKYTGVVTIDDDGKVLHETCFGSGVNGALNKKDLTKKTAKRWRVYASFLRDHLVSNGITGTIVVESPFNLHGSAAKLLELKGVYLVICAEVCDEDKIYLLSPTTIKKMFTGSGAASKEQMIEECHRRGYFTNNDNKADAYAAASTSIKGNIHDFT